MKKIRFDSENYNWDRDEKKNMFFVKCTANLIKETLECRRYLYLNQVYECFGVKWNPDEENVCYRDPDAFFIDFAMDDEGIIEIMVG